MSQTGGTRRLDFTQASRDDPYYRDHLAQRPDVLNCSQLAGRQPSTAGALRQDLKPSRGRAALVKEPLIRMGLWPIGTVYWTFVSTIPMPLLMLKSCIFELVAALSSSVIPGSHIYLDRHFDGPSGTLVQLRQKAIDHA